MAARPGWTAKATASPGSRRCAWPPSNGPERVADTFDALVVGGGAAGLMCALTAGQRGKRVLVVEHANRVGKKILMSGGGRCNFTNTGAAPANFISANPRSEEHTSELQSLMRISYAVFCLNKKTLN